MTLFAKGGGQVHVDIGIMAIGLCGLANSNEDAIAVAAVDQAMTIPVILGEGCAIARMHGRFTGLVDQHAFSCKNDDKFILSCVPMPLR